MTELTMTIGGEPASLGESFGVINPATGSPFMEAPECSRDQLDQAMDAASAAFKKWRTDEGARRECLAKCAEAVGANMDELAELVTLEQGKPLDKAKEEIMGAVAWLQVTGGYEIPVDVVQDDDACRIEIRRKPLGVVGAITPWNFPVILAVWKIAPALLTGNTMVLKPSPFTPLATLKLGEILRSALPPGVLNVVSGGNELGAWITEHPAVSKISFTGSVATGKKVMQAAAADLKRVTLELGGNDAAIVLADNDPESVAEKIFWGAFANSGQICSAIKRVYVDRSIYEPTLKAIAERAKQVKVGNGMDEGVELGPVNNLPQFERVCELVDDAKKTGARVMAGGDRLGDEGYFFQPTVLSDVDDNTRIVAEEQFGPALPVLPFDEVDEVIERANATKFGLSGSVWSRNVEHATEVVSQLECGTAWVNQHLAILPTVPFGGFKWSGIGRENGPQGLLNFTEIQTVNIAKK